MRGLNSASVDLIYLDPPFNSKVDYAAPVGSEAAGATFKDTWSLDDVDLEWIDLIATKHPALHRVVLAAMTRSDKSYLAYMAARLLEMKRLLKPTGSIYLHCDPTMSHYLKLAMDAIFGRPSFRSEVVWKRTAAHGGSRRWGPIHDIILYYSGGGRPTWNRVTEDYDADYLEKYFRLEDEREKFQPISLTGPGSGGGGSSGLPWRGVDPGERHWAVPEKRLPAWFEFPDGYSEMSSQERLDVLDDQGMIYWPPTGKMPRFKQYVSVATGIPVQDIVVDIKPLSGNSAERTDYPTQKPVDLLDRIIRVSSNKGDTVLDPFCGCATTLVAADRLERQWIGIDVSPKSAELVIRRIKGDQGMHHNIVHRSDLPQRTDLGKIPAYNSAGNRKQLYGEQGGNCAGCSEHFMPKHLEVDHIISRSKGGADHISNLQLLCGSCNRIKGDRGMEYLMSKLNL